MNYLSLIYSFNNIWFGAGDPYMLFQIYLVKVVYYFPWMHIMFVARRTGTGVFSGGGYDYKED